MRVRHRRPRAASRSPRRSTACSRRRAPNPACLRRPRSHREHKSLPLNVGPLRRSVGLLVVAAALSPAIPAGAVLVPIHRTFGDLTLPRVRKGTLTIPRNQASGRVRVIVGLPLPALASSQSRVLTAKAASRKLAVASPASPSYLARVAAAQRVAAARLVRAIPQARIGRHYQVVLDGVVVSLPVTALPALAR